MQVNSSPKTSNKVNFLRKQNPEILTAPMMTIGNKNLEMGNSAKKR